ncbi:unnamed protein product, partial [Owenia fusiformis]
YQKKAVKFICLSSERCAVKKNELELRDKVKSLKGTFKLHAISGIGNNIVMMSDVSCYCKHCLNGDFCDKWTVAKLTNTKSKNQSSSEKSDVNNNAQVHNEISAMRYNKDEFCAALYDEIGILERLWTEMRRTENMKLISWRKKAVIPMAQENRSNLGQGK